MNKSDSRLQKLESIPEKDRYPRDFPGRKRIKYVVWQYNSQQYAREKFPSLKDDTKYKISGRISARRDHGNNIFFDIFDQTGSIQLHAKREVTPSVCTARNVEAWHNANECDLGDMVGITGTLTSNSRGEPLLLIQNWTLLAKALREPPDKFHGISRPESRYRHRELDLLSSADSREVFKKRAEIVFEIRKYLNDRDFIEIETPILQPIYGGATAKPFKTHHNSLGQDFFLQISSELYLKRAMVGGFDRVYSFSRCFRNEGISPTHNPEFTNLEIFENCKTAEDMKFFVDNLIYHLTKKTGSINYLEKPLIEFKSNLLSSDWPLSRKHNNDKKYAEAWELFINDMEISSGASDLNDPHEQEARLKESEEKGLITNLDLEPTEFDPYDKNYIEALEQGALPWAGVGIGIDRLCMLLLDKDNIRDVLMFPTLRAVSADD